MPKFNDKLKMAVLVALAVVLLMTAHLLTRPS